MFKKSNLINLFVQTLLWLLLLFTPIISQIVNGLDWQEIIVGLKYNYSVIFMFPCVFYANYFLFIPKLLFQKRNTFFFITNTLFVYSLNYLAGIYLAYIGVNLLEYDQGLLLTYALGTLTLNILLILAAISLRSQQRNFQYEMKVRENERVQAEQELHRLKSQLNPHFLFNTLNNISSLISFNPDIAQDSMSRLSDMLRYVLYDSSAAMIAIEKEIDFMHNYIDLMKLRYTDTLKINVVEQIENFNTPVAPLLYISLIENAFKYGASSQHECFIDLQFLETPHQLSFVIKNSMIKQGGASSAKSGGVGLSNLAQRLELLYPDRYKMSGGMIKVGEADIYEATLIIEK